MRVFFPKLDSLRFLSFFFVYWDHCIAIIFPRIFNKETVSYLVPLTRIGGLGVQLFFVISGFLITYLLISEVEQKGRVDVIRFYKRRALRIWPLYFFCMIMGALFLPRILSAFTYCGNIFLGLFFLNNYDVIYYFSECPQAQMRISWSVAIEEQFYLFWPLLFTILIKFVKSNRYFWCLFLIGVSIAFATYTTGEVRYYHTLSNMGYLIAGCLGAFYIKENPSGTLLKIIQKHIWLIVLVTIIATSIRYYVEWLYLPQLILRPFLYLAIVLYFCFCLKTPLNIFDRWGKYTYGMYFYHTMIQTAIFVFFDILQLRYNQNNLIMFCASVLTLPATIVVSILSYNVLERPFLVLKKKLAVVQSR